MAFLLYIFLMLIVGLCVLCLFRQGMWGNAIRLINVVTAALLATNFWEPLARLIEKISFCRGLTYFWDFLCLWGLFGLFLLIFRLITDRLSRKKVRFHPIADHIGSGFFALWVGWVLVCFTMFTLHTAPLARNFFNGGFDPEKKMFINGPDRQWLGFVQRVSRGPFCRSLSKNEVSGGRYGERPDDSESEKKRAVFDRNGAFLPKYATRRAKLEENVASGSGFGLKVSESDAPRR